MIPTILVSGFLGAGKTTLLRRIAEANRERKIVYLASRLRGSHLTSAADRPRQDGTPYRVEDSRRG